MWRSTSKLLGVPFPFASSAVVGSGFANTIRLSRDTVIPVLVTGEILTLAGKAED